MAIVLEPYLEQSAFPLEGNRKNKQIFVGAVTHQDPHVTLTLSRTQAYPSALKTENSVSGQMSLTYC